MIPQIQTNIKYVIGDENYKFVYYACDDYSFLFLTTSEYHNSKPYMTSDYQSAQAKINQIENSAIQRWDIVKGMGGIHLLANKKKLTVWTVKTTIETYREDLLE